MQHVVDAAAPPITLLLLFAVGLELTLEDFRHVRDRPGMVAAGVLLPPLLLPLLATALIRLLDPAPLMASGLLLLVVCPIGGISNAYSALARASVALSVTMTAVSCGAAVVTIPAATALMERLLGHAAPYSAPARVLVTQILLILVPAVAAGMLLRAWRPALAGRHGRLVRGIALSLLAALVALVVASAAGDPEVGWSSGVVLVAAFVAVSFVLGALVAWALGGSTADRFTFSAEFSTRNLAVALAVAYALGSQRDSLRFAAIYAMVELPLVTAAALLARLR